jgi:hypothetical protein
MHGPPEFRYWISRLLLSLATAVVIAATAYVCAWLSAQKEYSRTEEHLKTRADLERLRAAIELHKKTTGTWPAQLTDLKVVKEKQVRVDDTGYPLDAWGQRLHYRIDADGWMLFSFGADGKPGGIGKYADMYAGQPDTWPEHPSLVQFSMLPESRPIQVACILAGVVAFPICLLDSKGQGGDRPSLARVLLANAVTAVFAILAALVISGLHLVPGGH